VTPRVLNFISYSSPLAQSQTQALIDHVETHVDGVRCHLEIVAPPAPHSDNTDNVFVALSQEQVHHCQQLISAKPGKLVVMEASDLPMPLPEDLAIVCIPPRTPPYDAYLNRDDLLMDEMEAGSTIGVMSLRLRSQMSALWPDLQFEILHGGIDRAMATHLQNAKLDGLVLPAAATEHLGIQGIVAEIYTPEFMLPSPGQGIVVVVGHRDDENSTALLAEIHSGNTAIEFETEKAFCSRMVSDQDLPVGVLAKVIGKQVIITGATGAGGQRVEVSGHTSEAEAVGSGLARQLLCSGASFMDLLEAEFPDGLPDEPGDVEDEVQVDEDAAILGKIDEDEEEVLEEGDFDDLEHMRALEDMAGIEDVPDDDGEDSEDELYD
jgi:hydroxymethylbilane synthase